MKKVKKIVNVIFIILFFVLGVCSMYAVLYENKIAHGLFVITDAIMVVVNYIDLVTKE